MTKITKISAQKRPGRYNIFLDNKYAFAVSEDVLIKFNLQKELEITDGQRAEIEQAEVNAKAYSLALNYLSYQMRTEKEIRQYLLDHEVESVMIPGVINRLQDQKLVNDADYAKAYVRTNMRLSLKGPQVLKQELQQKGIRNAEVLEDALLEYDEAALIANGTKLAYQTWKQQHHLAQRVRQQKVRQRLQVKGYRSGDLDLIWPGLVLENNSEDEADALTMAAEKAARHYQPLTDRKNQQKFKQSLARKGFDFVAINYWLEDHETD